MNNSRLVKVKPVSFNTTLFYCFWIYYTELKKTIFGLINTSAKLKNPKKQLKININSKFSNRTGMLKLNVNYTTCDSCLPKTCWCLLSSRLSDLWDHSFSNGPQAELKITRLLICFNNTSPIYLLQASILHNT